MELKRSEKVENNLTWFALKVAVANGTVRELVHSGDMIPVTLKNGEAVELVATYDQNGKLFFVFQDCLQGAMPMNERPTNKGGWFASEMRRYLNAEVFNLLPDDVQAVIAPTRILQVQYGKEIVSEDKLFLLSQTQVFGTDDWSSCEPKDTQLDVFTDRRSRVKATAGDSTVCWWLRSPLASSPGNFRYVHYYGIGGTSYGNGASNSYGVAPAFCL